MCLRALACVRDIVQVPDTICMCMGGTAQRSSPGELEIETARALAPMLGYVRRPSGPATQRVARVTRARAPWCRIEASLATVGA